MTRLLMLAMAAALLGSGSASAQIGGLATSPGPSPLGITSPLGIGPAAPVAPTGIPLGATELASPGVSPMTSGVSPAVPAIGAATTCSGAGALGNPAGTANPGPSGLSPGFGGGGLGGPASGTCATGSPSLGPAPSASAPTGMGLSTLGRAGIPLGSTELNVGGLSPPPDALTPNPS